MTARAAAATQWSQEACLRRIGERSDSWGSRASEVARPLGASSSPPASRREPDPLLELLGHLLDHRTFAGLEESQLGGRVRDRTRTSHSVTGLPPPANPGSATISASFRVSNDPERVLDSRSRDVPRGLRDASKGQEWPPKLVARPAPRPVG